MSSALRMPLMQLLRCLLAIFIVFLVSDVTRSHSATAETSAARRARVHDRNVNQNVNRNANRNIDIDRDIDVDIDVDHRYGGCCYRGGWGTAAAVATTAVVTAAVVGSVVHTLPPSCSVVIVNGFTYQQCESTWYQPQIAGSSTTYVVVNAPR